MKDHKYRGKSVEKGNLVYGYGCFTDESSKYWILLSENNWIQVEAIQQSTNLHDKNGKEIYEGDFLIDADDPEPMRHRIVWLEDEAKFELKTLADEEGNWDYFIIDALADLDMKDFEIIGNIYENPKLLK